MQNFSCHVGECHFMHMQLKLAGTEMWWKKYMNDSKISIKQ